MTSIQWCNPCIFMCHVVTSTSMQSRVLDVADFNDLMISAKSESATLCCHVNLMLQVNPCIILRCLVRMFCRSYYALSIRSIV